MKKEKIVQLIINVLFIITVLIVYTIDYRSNITVLKDRQKSYVTIQKQVIHDRVARMLEHIDDLSSSKALKKYLTNTSNEVLRNELGEYFLGFTRYSSKDYFQVRYLDKYGFEKVRVNQKDGLVSLTPRERLQDKSKSLYFKNISSMTSDKTYFVSALDLNKENKKVEYPYRPTIRIAKRIVGKGNKFVGALIINYEASEFFSFLRKQSFALEGNISILNGAGYWVLDFNEKREWGHIIPERKHYNFLQIHKGVTRLPGNGFHKLSNGLYFFNKLFVNESFFNNTKRLKFKNKVLWAEEWNIAYRIPYEKVAFLYYRLEMYVAVLIVMLLIVNFLIHLYCKANSIAREKEEVKKVILDTSPSAVITISKDGIVKDLNLSAEKMFLVRKDFLIGKNINTLMPEPYAAEHDGYLKKYMNSNQSSILGISLREVPARKTNGEIFPVEIKINEMTLSDERYFVGVLRDLTEEKKYIEEKVKAERDSLNKEKFMSLLSHDLRTPVGNIKSFAGLLLHNSDDLEKDEVSQILTKIINISDESLELVTNILNSQRAKDGDLVLKEDIFVINDLLRSVVDTFQTQYSFKKINLSYKDVSEEQSISADKALLRQVFSNLLSNANKFCDAGNTVSVTLSKKGDAYAWIIVKDDGPGMSDELRRDVFSKTVKTTTLGSRNEKGTGFGLPFCHEIVTGHNGVMTVKSTLGKGTEFDILLPLVDKKIS
jgi:PAS domain S-box-containing protein